MRIVLLTAGVRGIGTYCVNLYHRLRAEGHEVLLISERSWEKESIESFYQAHSFMLFGMAPVVYRPGDLVRAILEFEPDLIHHHWPCGTMDFLFGMVAKHGIPYVVTVHVSLASKQHILDRFWFRLFSVYRRWMPRAAAVNCISDFVRRQLAQRVSVPHDRVHRIYAGVDVELFRPLGTTGDDKGGCAGEDRIDLLFVGQIMPEKGIDLLVHAVMAVGRERPDITLTIVGHGPMEKKLRRLTKGCPGIRWEGFLPTQADVAARYARSDATVLPTRWDEAFSLVPLESFACGTPVIATARGGTVEQVTEGVTGYLLRDGSVEELTERLRSLELSELRMMRHACRRRVLERHTLAMMGEKHIELYREALNRWEEAER